MFSSLYSNWCEPIDYGYWDYITYINSGIAEQSVLPPTYPTPDNLSFGICGTLRSAAPGGLAFKFNLGYDLMNLILAKAGVAFHGFFVKGIIGYPLDPMWYSFTPEFGGIWGIEGGYEFSF